MALAKGNYTSNNPTVGSNVYTFNHTPNAGSDKFFFLMICVPSTITISSATYDSVPLDSLDFKTWGGTSLNYYTFTNIPNFTTSKEVRIVFNVAPNTSIGVYAQSFTDCSGVEQSGTTNLQNSPNNRNITAQENSIIFGCGTSLYSIPQLQLDGVNYFSPNFITDNNVQGKRCTGQISNNVSAGNVAFNTITGASSFQVSNNFVEFIEAIEPPPTGLSEGNWLPLL